MREKQSVMEAQEGVPKPVLGTLSGENDLDSKQLIRSWPDGEGEDRCFR